MELRWAVSRSWQSCKAPRPSHTGFSWHPAWRLPRHDLQAQIFPCPTSNLLPRSRQPAIQALFFNQSQERLQASKTTILFCNGLMASHHLLCKSIHDQPSNTHLSLPNYQSLAQGHAQSPSRHHSPSRQAGCSRQYTY